MNNKTPTASDGRSGPLPLVVGVTGHRDLRPADEPALEAKVRGVLQDFRQRYPHTPLLVLSPLAEGADRLVARVGLECGASLVVPLPLPRSIYEADFETPESLAEFRQLLERAEHHFELPLVHGDTPENIKQWGEHRNRQYALVGGYIARHSQIFFALWDGVTEDEKEGGTAQIVRFRLEGVPVPFAPPRSPLDSGESGAIYHIVTPRRDQTEPDESLQLKMIYPEGKDADSDRRTYDRMEYFNHDALDLKAPLTATRQSSQDYLIPSEEIVGLPPTLQRIIDHYATADSLAIHFAQKTTQTLGRVFFAVFLAALFFNLFHSLPHPHPPGAHGEEHATFLQDGRVYLAGPPAAAAGAAESHGDAAHGDAAHGDAAHGDAAHGDAAHTDEAHGDAAHGDAAHGDEAHSEVSGVAALSPVARLRYVPWALLGFLGISALATFVLHRRAAQGDYQNKYQDYRALAEGMRMQVFWRLAGLRDSVADHYLGRQRGELEWIRNALRAWDINAEATGATVVSHTTHEQHQSLDLTRRRWVEDQRRYYAKKAHREQEELEATEHRINLLLQASVAMAVLLAVILLAPLLLPLPWLETIKLWIENEWIHGWYMVALVMLAVAAGLMHGHNQQLARAEHAKQFSRMSVLFDIADRRLEEMIAAGHYRDARDLLKELGKESLEENGDWVLLHRERPLEVPHAA